MSVEHPDARDLRIGRIVNEYLDRKRRGEPVCEQELLDGNPDVAEELREHFGLLGHVSSGGAGGSLPGDQAAGLPEDALPGYDLLGELHRGGQGVVYEAIQKSTHRKVAVKVMREGPFAGWRDRARFEREVQILAALKHPRIATIHDSGVASHCHYFVMDYIQGLPLDAWMTCRQRSTEEVLRLFAKICDAVNAAHVKGIIHRDLKHGNIRIDEHGEPHILDFGLAKVTTDGRKQAEPDLDVGSSGSMTMVGQFVGSLPWTSPEQAQGRIEQIDTRTDVYALGVTLYHMLTGRFPYEVVGPVRDVLNRIVSSEPVRPGAIRRDIKRDVEAIVLRCLRKEPHRRYQNAGELGRDIERCLNGQPVAARSDSGLYVLMKTLRRHWVPVAVAAAFILLIGVSWRQAVVQRDRAIIAQRQQQRERNRADEKAAEADQARHIAEAERSRAQEQAERLRRTTYLNRIALAQNACEQKYLTQAQFLLEDCPADLRGWEWHYLNQLSRPMNLLDIRADDECVMTLATSFDGEHIVTAGCDGVIRTWESGSGQPVAQFVGHSRQVNAVACSPDGRWIASAGRDKTLRLWDRASGSQQVLQQAGPYIHALAFSPDSKELVTGGQAKVLAFWNLAGNQAEVGRTSSRHDGEISAVAYSPDGRQVVSGEYVDLLRTTAKVRMWDAATATLLREIEAHRAGILTVAFAPDGKRIATGSSIPRTGQDAHGTLKVFDGKTGEELLSLTGHEGFVNHLAFSPDGALLASAGSPRVPAFGMEADRTLKIWDAVTGEELHTYSAHDGGGRALAWSPDGRLVFSGGMDGRIKSWPARVPSAIRVLQGHSAAVLRVAFSPDGKHIASSSGQGESYQAEGSRPDNSVRIWDLQSGSAVVLDDHQNAVLALDWSRDGRLVASGGVDGTVRIWDHATGTTQQVIAGFNGLVRSVAFSPDGLLVGGAVRDTLVFWKVADGSVHERMPLDENLVTVTFSPDGEWMAAASESGRIVLREWASGEKRAFQTASGLTGAWFSPDSGTLATGHENGTIRLWELSTGRQTGAMTGPQRPVHWADFSPDGERLASCTTDMMLKIWDVRSGNEVFSVRAHDGPVNCVRFSPDGTAIATCGQDSLVKIWESQMEPAPQQEVKNLVPGSIVELVREEDRTSSSVTSGHLRGLE